MEVLKEAGRILNLKMVGNKWVKEAASVLVQTAKDIREIEDKKKEECEPYNTQIADIRNKYKPALDPLNAIDSRLRERVLKEAESEETVTCEDGGKLAFPVSWGYKVVDYAKVPKELKMEAVDDKEIRERIKKGIRQIKGLEIVPVRSLRVYTENKED